MIDNTTIITLVFIFALGVSLLVYREQIARYLGRNSLLPFRLILGERAWIAREERRAEKFAKVVLPFAALFCFISIALIIGAIVW